MNHRDLSERNSAQIEICRVFQLPQICEGRALPSHPTGGALFVDLMEPAFALWALIERSRHPQLQPAEMKGKGSAALGGAVVLLLHRAKGIESPQPPFEHLLGRSTHAYEVRRVDCLLVAPLVLDVLQCFSEERDCILR